MYTPSSLLSVGLMSVMSAAAAQTYGPQDEGRRFDDGSRVVCKNVEVRQNSRDPNRVAGTAIGIVGMDDRQIATIRETVRPDTATSTQCPRPSRVADHHRGGCAKVVLLP